MHNSWRFYDHLRIGSCTNRTGWGLPDPGFVRGPTYVILPLSQRKMEVPATRKAHVIAPGDAHEHDRSKGILNALHGMLQGKRGPLRHPHGALRHHVGGGVPAVLGFDDDGNPFSQQDHPMKGDVHEM